MTHNETPPIAISGPIAAELRVRTDVLRRVLTELVDRAAPAESQVAGMLRLAREHAEVIAGALEERDED